MRRFDMLAASASARPALNTRVMLSSVRWVWLRTFREPCQTTCLSIRTIFSWMRARQSTTQLIRSRASSAFLLRTGSIVPLRCGGRVTHRTFTPAAVFVRNKSPSLATRLGVTKPENMTIDSLALARSDSTAASNVDWLKMPMVCASKSNGTRSKSPRRSLSIGRKARSSPPGITRPICCMSYRIPRRSDALGSSRSRYVRFASTIRWLFARLTATLMRHAPTCFGGTPWRNWPSILAPPCPSGSSRTIALRSSP
jgi:hypothetical protein